MEDRTTGSSWMEPEVELSSSSSSSNRASAAGDDHDVVDDGNLSLVIIGGIAVAVNVLLAVVVMTSRRLRRGAVALLVFTMVATDGMHVFVLRLCLVFDRPGKFAFLGCQFCLFLDSLLFVQSMSLLVAIAREHYLAVVRPLSLQHRKDSPVVWCLKTVLLCTVLAAVFALPNLFVYEMVEHPSNATSQCLGDGESPETKWTTLATPTVPGDTLRTATTPSPSPTTTTCPIVTEFSCDFIDDESTKTFACARHVVFFVALHLIPMSLVGFMYGMTAYRLAETDESCRGNSSQSTSQWKQRRRTARSAIALVVIVVVCPLPMFILPIFHSCPLVSPDVSNRLFRVHLNTAAVNYMRNAITLLILCPQYRMQLLAVLGIRWLSRRSGCCRAGLTDGSEAVTHAGDEVCTTTVEMSAVTPPVSGRV